MTAQVTQSSAPDAASRRTTTSAARRPTADKRRSNLLTVVMWVCVLYFIVPLIWLFISSTKDNRDLFTTFGLWFGHDFNLFANIADVFTYHGRHLPALGAEHRHLRGRERGRREPCSRPWRGTRSRSTSSRAARCCSASPWARS